MHEAISTHGPDEGAPHPRSPAPPGSCGGAGHGLGCATSLTVTVVEPEERAPLGRLEGWLLEHGATLRTVRLWRGAAVPSLEEAGDLLVVLGGAMSAHDDADHPWLAGLRRLIRDVVRTGMPAVAVCLGAQVAAEALGGRTAVPSPYGREGGIVGLRLEPEAWGDPILGHAVAEAVRAADAAGVPTEDDDGGTCLPAIVSHDDVVVALPDDAVLLASSPRAPVQAWRAGRLLALQHHPESSPRRVGYWQARSTARRMGVTGAGSMELADMPAQAVAAGRAAQEEAEAVDPVVQAFGRALTRTLVEAARARGPRRSPSAQPPTCSQSSSASMTV